MYGSFNSDISFRAYDSATDDTWISGLLSPGEVLSNIIGSADIEVVMESVQYGQLQYVQLYTLSEKVLQFGHTYANPNQTSIRGRALIDWISSQKPLVEYLQFAPTTESFATLIKQRYPEVTELANGSNTLLRIGL